ncbi:MAG: hypothetical protein MPN21_14650 [Thermoanaerobaculia bacterium]|nr:hypothetical protein [Thermoanaerobaculia bacterium]
MTAPRELDSSAAETAPFLDATGVHEEGLRGLVVYSLVAGACPLIPIPLLDDWVLDQVRRRLVSRLASAADCVPPGPALGVLADKEPTDWRPEALAKGCLRTIFIAPLRFIYRRILRKLLRKILFVLAVKDAVDEFSTTFHHGLLLRRAFESGHCPMGRNATWDLRRRIDTVCDSLDPRPVESSVRSAFRHSRRILRQAAWMMSQLGRRMRRRGRSQELDDRWVDEAAARTEADAGGLVDELLASLRREAGYLQAVEARLDRHLGTAEVTSAPLD